MTIVKFFFAFALLFSLTGCADITMPTPEYIIERPIGTDSVKIGMTKSRVRDLWGNPDQINEVTQKGRWGGEREEWVYFARSKLPIDAGYLSKTKKLYFDGENLTNITEE
ncbi:MAG: hypothetical protein ISS91_04730 [Candidatus Omnitrophica bacterium]|nr:hypothetical protein [Candidatus Omnitrophota bacterium]